MDSRFSVFNDCLKDTAIFVKINTDFYLEKNTIVQVYLFQSLSFKLQLLYFYNT